jgi:hypothetical protein
MFKTPATALPNIDSAWTKPDLQGGGLVLLQQWPGQQAKLNIALQPITEANVVNFDKYK